MPNGHVDPGGGAGAVRCGGLEQPRGLGRDGRSPRLHVLTYVDGQPRLARGFDVRSLGPAMPVAFSVRPPHGVWMEAVVPDAADAEGISRLVVEVNGKDTDEIVMQNNIPVRKHPGWMSSGKAPGEITGDSQRLVVKVRSGWTRVSRSWRSGPRTAWA
jgi:hypothetical protein